MEKEFCTYNQSLRLKALGFDEPCFGVFYSSEDRVVKVLPSDVFNEKTFIEKGFLKAPTFSQAFRWFREKHELTWEHSFDDSQIQLYVGEIAYPDNCLDFFKSIEVKYDCYNKAFEEAELACLDKLLEIVEFKTN